MRDILKSYKVFDIDLYRLRSRNFHTDMIRDREALLTKLAGYIKPDDEFICPLCRCVKAEIYLSWRDYHLFECNNCALVAPNLHLTRLRDFNLHEGDLVREDLKREIIASFDYRKSTFGQERVAYLQEILPGFPAKDEWILDIGCGPGYFLSCLKDRQISAKGLEVNSTCISHCNDLGLEVSAGELAKEGNCSFSLITMFDVLEHLHDPIAILQDANRKLREGGHLLAYIPNIHSIGILLMGGEHNMIAPFNHLCFFDRKSLSFLAEATGFAIERVDFHGLDIIDYFAMKEAEDCHPYFDRLRQMTGPVQAMIDKQEQSNCMRVFFRKISTSDIYRTEGN